MELKSEKKKKKIFAYQKNHEYLIKIMERLHEIDSSIKLLLVGEGPKEKEIHDLVKNKGLEDTIVFFGTSKRREKGVIK